MHPDRKRVTRIVKLYAGPHQIFRPWNEQQYQLLVAWDIIAESPKANELYMGRAMRKRVFNHMRTANAQISLRIRAV